MSSVDQLAEQLGLPSDQLRLLLCLFILVPLAVPYRMLQSANLKHIFSIVVSLSMLYFTLGPWAWMHSFISSTVAYLFVKYLPRGYAHLVVFIFMMGYMSASHIYRMYTDWMGWSLDFTSSQMVITIKMTTFAINYYDGNCSKEQQEKMNSFQKKYRFSKLPNLLQFYGFVYFYPTFLVGPPSEIKDYLSFTDGSMFADDKTSNAQFPLKPALYGLFCALLTLPCTVVSMMFLPLSFLTSAGFSALAFWQRIIYIWLYVALARWKYYLAWYFIEAGVISSGIGYNGKDNKGNIKWDRIKCCYPLLVEFPENIRQCVESWNIPVQTWLKNYIYIRLANAKYSTLVCTVTTYSMSAFWHGFYPGYYTCFVFAAFLTEAAKNVRRKIRPLFMKEDGVTPKPNKAIYDFVGIVTSAWMMNYAGISFLLLVLGPSWTVYSQVYFVGHIGLVVVMLLLSFMRTPKNQPPRSKAD